MQNISKSGPLFTKRGAVITSSARQTQISLRLCDAKGDVALHHVAKGIEWLLSGILHDLCTQDIPLSKTVELEWHSRLKNMVWNAA